MINGYNEKVTRKLFFSLVPVQILLVMCGGVNIIIDSAFASNLIGPNAVAATGLYGPPAKVLDTINALIFGGAQILCGRYLGENTLKRARSIFTLDMITVTLIGIAGTVLFFFFPEAVARVVTRPDNPLIPDLIDYLRGISSGVIPFLLGTQLTSFLQLENKDKLGYIGIGGMFVANTICDYVFIGVLNMGIFGLGLATAVSNWVPVIVAGIYFLSKKSVFSLDMSDLHIRDLGEISKHGFPTAGTQFLLAFKSIILNAIILRFAGSDGLASFAAVNSFGYVYWAVPAGMSSAMITLASIYAGEKDEGAVDLLMRIYIKKAVPIVAGASVVMALLAYPLTNLFFHDPSSPVYSMTLIGFILFPLYAPFSTLVVGFRDLWRCLEHKFAVNYIVFCDGLLYVTLLSYIMSSFWGMTGIWIAQVAGCVLMVLTIPVISLIINKKMPRGITDLCCYPAGFGVDADRRLNLSIHSMKEVINISEHVISFCLDHGIAKSTANRAGLCIEELAGNIVSHGFTGRKNESVDISVTVSGEELIIKFKDNGVLFNPKEIDDIFVPEDPARNAGIRIVKNISKEMEYHSLLGLNILSITI